MRTFLEFCRACQYARATAMETNTITHVRRNMSSWRVFTEDYLRKFEVEEEIRSMPADVYEYYESDELRGTRSMPDEVYDDYDSDYEESSGVYSRDDVIMNYGFRSGELNYMGNGPDYFGESHDYMGDRLIPDD